MYFENILLNLEEDLFDSDFSLTKLKSTINFSSQFKIQICEVLSEIILSKPKALDQILNKIFGVKELKKFLEILPATSSIVFNSIMTNPQIYSNYLLL
ncbi:MAG: hypothetical protein H0U57_12305 [Tatlockia sp.]|nr:hypothetical protein [Tatlockia sp.]